MQLLMEGIDGKLFVCDVQPTDTILSLKRQVRKKKMVPIDRMKLRCKGRFLDDERTLSDYSITKDDFLIVSYSMGGETYCLGCIVPALICLSANVSLQCQDTLPSDGQELLRSIQVTLAILNNNAMEAIMDYVQSCKKNWSPLEIEDVEFFQNHTARRHSQAISSFIGAICHMIKPYLERYRKPKAVKDNQSSIYSTNNYYSIESEKSILTEPISRDWFNYLHQTRCPICFYRFTYAQIASNTPNRYAETSSCCYRTSII